MKKVKFKWIIILLGIIAFFILSISVYHKPAIWLDNLIYNFISKNIISNKLTPFIKVITNLGSAFILIILAISCYFGIKNKKIGICIVLNLCIEGSCNFLIKNILRRERPIGIRLVEEKGFSFPSGHSMASFAFYGLLIYFIYIKVDNKYIKFFSIVILSLIILCIGMSRIYLGAHYATDVLGGYVLALSYLIVFITISKKYILGDK